MSEPHDKTSRFNVKYIGIICTVLAMVVSVAIWAGSTSEKVTDNVDDIIYIQAIDSRQDLSIMNINMNQAVIMSQLQTMNETLEEIKEDVKALREEQ